MTARARLVLLGRKFGSSYRRVAIYESLKWGARRYHLCCLLAECAQTASMRYFLSPYLAKLKEICGSQASGESVLHHSQAKPGPWRGRPDVGSAKYSQRRWR